MELNLYHFSYDPFLHLNVSIMKGKHMAFQTLLSIPRCDISLPTYCWGEL